MKLGILYDDVFTKHISQHSHPERPQRIISIKEKLIHEKIWEKAKIFPARNATREELTKVHKDFYVERIISILEKRGWGYFDPDTYYSPDTYNAALGSAGGCIDIGNAVYNRDIDIGLALTRPPGHHAEEDRAMGFCIFNNIALVAKDLLSKGANKILIFDWDVHHGNGTQHAFDNNKDVVFISVHQWPHYPGSGLCNEIGIGNIANVPYTSGAVDQDYAAVIDRLVLPIIDNFKPDIILVSAGFDAHELDSLSGMNLSDKAFGYMSLKLNEAAQKYCQGRLLFVLEGGYNLEALPNSILEVIKAIQTPQKISHPGVQTSIAHQKILDETINNLKTYWNNLTI